MFTDMPTPEQLKLLEAMQKIVGSMPEQLAPMNHETIDDAWATATFFLLASSMKESLQTSLVQDPEIRAKFSKFTNPIFAMRLLVIAKQELIRREQAADKLVADVVDGLTSGGPLPT